MARLYDGAKAPQREGGALALVNPAAARGGGASLWRRLEGEVRGALPGLAVAFTRAQGDAEAQAYEWGLRNAGGCLLAVGGDGTVHEAVNGIWRSGSRACFALVPTGSGNDFARNAGIPLDPFVAVRSLARAIPRALDLGLLAYQAGADTRQRVFLNSVSLGLSVRANRWAHRIPWGPGRLRYTLGGLVAILSGAAERYRIGTDGTFRFEGLALNLTVANGACFGGGMRLSPASVPTDGRLELIVLAPMSRLRALRALAALQRGRHLELPEFRVESIRSVQLAGPPGRWCLEADGEELETAGSLEVTVLPGRLPLLR